MRAKKERRGPIPPFFPADPANCELEQHAQRHLYLPRAADCFVRDAEATQRRAGIEARIAGDFAAGRFHRGTRRREPVEEQVLADVVDGYVEARRVGEVEHFRPQLEPGLFPNRGVFKQRKIEVLYPSGANIRQSSAGSTVGKRRGQRENCNE